MKSLTKAARAAAAAAAALVVFHCGCGAGPPWSIQTQAREASLLSVAAGDRTHAWAVGGGPVYFFNGVSWAVQAEGLEAEPVDVASGDATHAWACGGEGKGMVWSSEGEAWSLRFESPDSTMSLITAAGPADVWSVGTSESGSNIYHFNGADWSVQHSAPLHFQDIFALDATHVWGVAEDRSGRSYACFFDGASWKRQFKAPKHHFLLGVAAADPGHVWAVGSLEEPGPAGEEPAGVVFFSDGRTWKKQADLPEQMHKVACGDARSIWAVGGIGSSGPVYFSDGTTWKKQFDARESLFDVAAPDAGRAWAVGGLGGIFVYEAPFTRSPTGSP